MVAQPQQRRVWGWFSVGTLLSVPPRDWSFLEFYYLFLQLFHILKIIFLPFFKISSFPLNFLLFFSLFLCLLRGELVVLVLFFSFAPRAQGHRDTYPASRKRPLLGANKYISSQLRCIIPREIAGIPAPVYFGAEISHPSRSAAPCGGEAGRAPPGAGTARAGSAGLRYRRAPGAEHGPMQSVEAGGRQNSVRPGMERAAGEIR